MYVMGFRWALTARPPHDEMHREEFSALVAAGRLLLSRTVFDQFGVADGGPDSVVDMGSVQAHLRWVDTNDVIVSLTPVGADGPAESAGPVTTSSEVPGAGAAPAPAVVVTPQHHDEFTGSGESPEPRLSRRDTVAQLGITERSRLRAGTVFPQVAPVVLIQHRRSQTCRSLGPAPGTGPASGRQQIGLITSRRPPHKQGSTGLRHGPPAP